MEKSIKKEILRRSGLLLAGTVLNSMGIAIFLDPYNVITGGVTGIAMAVNYATHGVIGTGWISLIINIPLLIIGIIFIGKLFAAETVIATAMTSGFIELWSAFVLPYMPPVSSPILVTLAGGITFGGGVGLIFRAGGSTAGTDIIVKLLRKKFRTMKTGRIAFILDFVILLGSIFIYRDLELFLLATLSVFLYTTAFDFVLYGGNPSMLVLVITSPEKEPEIRQDLINELDIGATLLDATGAYTGNDKSIILCTVKNYMYPKLLDVIKKRDDKAFTIVTSAKEIFGEGYKSHDDEEL